MNITIDKKKSRDENAKLIDSLPRVKKFDAKKFGGKIKLKKSPLEIQHELRNEWQ
jgi:hypothetical protein